MKIIKGFCFLAVIAATACNQPAKQQEAAQADTTAAAKPVEAQVADTGNTSEVFKAYIALKDEFLKSDQAGVKTAATALEAKLSGIKGCSETAAVANQISNATDIKAQRESFLVLSKDVIALIKGAKFKSAPIYVDFCPMADGGKGGYWLSSTKPIENPYFPEHMKECGTVKEQIN
jgi:Cu(I)/Ag(I) efflux system membrane fusion protein